MSQQVLRLLGLGLRARRVVVGVSGTRAELQAGKLACVVLAADATQRTRDKVDRPARAKGIPVVAGPGADALGQALGRPAVQAVGVKDPALARGLIAASDASEE